jgi:hypothetical protein
MLHQLAGFPRLRLAWFSGDTPQTGDIVGFGSVVHVLRRAFGCGDRLC